MRRKRKRKRKRNTRGKRNWKVRLRHLRPVVVEEQLRRKRKELRKRKEGILLLKTPVDNHSQ